MAEKATPVVDIQRGQSQDPSPLVMQMLQREMEHIEKLFETKLASLRTEILTKLDGIAKALELQALEYGRRMDELNHAREAADKRDAEFLPRDLYEKGEKDSAEWRRIVDRERAANSGQRTAYMSLFAAALSILSLAFVAYGVWR